MIHDHDMIATVRAAASSCTAVVAAEQSLYRATAQSSTRTAVSWAIGVCEGWRELPQAMVLSRSPKCYEYALGVRRAWMRARLVYSSSVMYAY